MNILVLCTGNSARSILLESLLNSLGEGRVSAFSAGSNPTGQVHPQSLVLLQEKQHDTSNMRSKSWDEFATADAPHMDIVITVCADAADEICPFWPGAPITTHWGVDDPAAAQQSDWAAAFQQAYRTLALRAEAFLSLPFETMPTTALKHELDRIGTLIRPELPRRYLN